MTREEAINTLKENYCAMCFYGSQDMESCDIRYCDNKDAIKALEQEPTTKNDLGVEYRSLEDIKKLVESKADDLDGVMLDASGVIIGLYFAIANDLPSVTPIRPKGHWIPVYQGDEIINYRCSECEFGNTFGKSTVGMDFCPRCGADNREVEE